jgi:hypothetical protein
LRIVFKNESVAMILDVFPVLLNCPFKRWNDVGKCEMGADMIFTECMESIKFVCLRSKKELKYFVLSESYKKNLINRILLSR